MSKVYIILLNYKNWQDTIECLQSLSALEYQYFETVIVDNQSGNDSISHIKEYLEANPVTFSIHFIQLEANLGFGKGNNEGLRWAINKGDGDFFWILNNDTVVDPLALTELVQGASHKTSIDNKIGLFGSKLRYYDKREYLQAVGGHYNKWLATLKEVGNLEKDLGQYDLPSYPNVLIGASFFASKDFLLEVGLLPEDYFIYFEEADWAARAKKKGWKMMVLPQSLIFHKQGVTTQASGLANNQKSKFSDFYYFRNRLMITYKYYPYCLPTVYLSFLVTAFNRWRRGQSDRLVMMKKIMFRFTSIDWKEVV